MNKYKYIIIYFTLIYKSNWKTFFLSKYFNYTYECENISHKIIIIVKKIRNIRQNMYTYLYVKYLRKFSNIFNNEYV